MSFLAQLRQQQPDTGQGLQLCYLLRIDRRQRSASLALTLSSLREGRMAESGKAYVIQRPHLQTPPPFLDTGDVQRLQALVDASGDWLRHSSGPLPELETWRFLRGLLGSGRCFVEAGSHHRAALVAAADQPLELHWITDQAGWQRLDWRPCSAGSLFFVASSFTEGFVYQPARGTLARCQHGLGAAALATVLPCCRDLDPEAVTAVLRDRQRWRELGLPLPREIVRQSVPATVTPVLHCAFIGHPETAGIQDVLQLRFRYCSEHFCVSLIPGAGAAALDYWDGTQLREMVRQPEREKSWQQQLAAYLQPFAPGEEPATWRAQDQQAWRQLLAETRPALEAQGFQVTVAPGFRHHYVVADRWEARIDRAGAAAWQLSVQLSVGGDPVDLLALLAQLSHHERSADPSCLRLADGRLLLLPPDKVSGLMAELGDLLQYASPAAGGGYRLPDTQIHRLHSLSGQLPDATQWQGDLAALEQATDLHRAPEVLDREGCGIRAQLRPYQWQGVCWLQHLRRHRANGLLADDMGLGKTLQTLAHLCLEHREDRLHAPALIVAPTSLLHNWSAEINRFAPHLRRKIIHGPQRHRQWERLRNFDILITSYPLIVNDLPHWRQHRLSWVVLDEAQWIKNPRTQVSQAVRQLASDQRLCLSGTPVENHLGELWSILDFLMPRCLGSAGEFKRYFRTPIERDADSDRLQQLLQRVAPFMLRRSKDQVARDLPPKTEIHQTIDLADDQRVFYDGLKTAGWAELQSRLADTTRDGQRQILVLTALLKLRQACCDPQLLGATGVSSSKRAHCIEMIEELVAEGRAILVFSQFTAMLELLARDLEQQDIGYLMLTGQTRDRQARVDAFQQGAAPVFLISLKAGGVGLNLTRADTVIHYDPWWNSTAEQQATDRAHRIGQDKPVFVYKLIAENTIEEKIATLQQRKALLSRHVNHQAQASGERFAVELEELLTLLQQEATGKETPLPC